MNIIESTAQIIPDRTPEVIAAEIRTIEDHVCKTVLQGVVEIGNRLQEVRNIIPHGQWEDWCRDNLDYSLSKAKQYIRLAKEYGNENSPYFREISNRQLMPKLGISNALALLQVPEDEIKDFVEAVDIAEISTKELEEEINRLKAEKEAGNEEIKRLLEESKLSSQAVDNLNSEISALQKRLGEAEQKPESTINQELVDSLETELEDAKIALEKEKDKGKKLKEQLKQEKDSVAEKIKAAEEAAKAKAAEEAETKVKEQMELIKAERDEAVKRAESAEAKAEAQSNDAVIKFKIIVDDLQIAIDKATSTLSEIEGEAKEKLRDALKQIISCRMENI